MPELRGILELKENPEFGENGELKDFRKIGKIRKG